MSNLKLHCWFQKIYRTHFMGYIEQKDTACEELRLTSLLSQTYKTNFQFHPRGTKNNPKA